MSGAQIRMADALLRGCGGGAVLLRMPAPAIPGDDTEQLGEATPQFQDVPVGPAVWRVARTPEGGELMLSATAVEALVGSLAFDSAALLFRAAAGVVIEGDLLEIVSAVGVVARGTVAVYRVTVRARAALVA